MSTFEPTPRTTPARKRERVSYDADAAHAVLDEALLCHVGVVVDGHPRVLPTIHTRVADRLYLHGSTGSTLARLAATGDGVDVCVTVTLLDGLVLARSQMHHSMNYRSVVAHGRARAVSDPEEKRRALQAVVDHVVPGRSRGSRPPSARELAATAVLALDLVEVSVKSRAGDPGDDAEDLDGPHWAGVVPVATALGDPVPAPDLVAGIAVPDHVTARVEGGRAAPARPVSAAAGRSTP